MKATIKDVAKEAGVSIMTVSRVINKREYIAPATKEKALRVVKKLNYMPNKVARSLVVKKTNFIGLLVPDIANPFLVIWLKGRRGLPGRGAIALFLEIRKVRLKMRRNILKHCMEVSAMELF